MIPLNLIIEHCQFYWKDINREMKTF